MLAACPSPGQAHGDPASDLSRHAEALREGHADPETYLARAQLHHRAGRIEAALEDLGEAIASSPDRPDLAIARATVLLDAGQASAAASSFGRVLAAAPRDARARIGRARAFAAMGLRHDAARDYTLGIAAARTPVPDHYLERARVLTREGDEFALAEAVRGLDQGLALLGPVPSLALLAIELEARRGAFDAALERIDALAATWPQTAPLWVRRGDLLQRAARPDAARESYERALDALAQMRRTTPARAQLEQRATQALAALAPPPEARR